MTTTALSMPTTLRIPVGAVVRVSLVAIALFGTYTNIVGGGLYGGYAVAAGLGLLAMRLPQRPDVYVAFGLLGLCFAVIYAAGPWVAEDLTTRGVETAVQTFGAIVAAYGVGRELMAWRTERVAQLALVSTVLVLGAGFGELHVPAVKSVSDSFRTAAYEGRFIYESDARDQALHGEVRPKIFTQEPSHPAKFAAVMLAAWFLLTATRRRWAGLLLLLGAAAYVMRSPSLLICPAVIGLGLLASGRFQWTRVAAVAGLLVALVTAPAWIGAIPLERFQAIGRGEDPSALVRVDAPLAATRYVLADYPLFGAGLRNSDESRDAVLASFTSFSGISTGATREFTNAGWGNGLFHLIAFTGLVGFLLVLGWIVWFSRWAFGMRDTVTVIALVAVVLSLEGTFSLARPWFYLFLLLAVFSHRLRHEDAVGATVAGVGDRGRHHRRG